MVAPKLMNKPTKKSKKTSETKTVTTHILAVIDQSGSMAGKEQAVVTGLNEIVKTAKADMQKGGSLVTLSVVRLDSIVLPFDLLKANANEVSEFKNDWYTPGGVTPLYDAIGTGVVTLEQADDANSDAAYVVYILTDGLENASRLYNAEMIQSNIKRLESTNRWTFIWSITKADFSTAAAALNFNTRNMQGYENTYAGTLSTAVSTSSGMKSFLSARRNGTTSSDNFYIDHAGESSAEKQTDPLNLNFTTPTVTSWPTTISKSTGSGIVSPPISWTSNSGTNSVNTRDSTIQPPDSWTKTEKKSRKKN